MQFNSLSVRWLIAAVALGMQLCAAPLRAAGPDPQLLAINRYLVVMRFARKCLLRRFPNRAPDRAPDDRVADALHDVLYSAPIGITVDGWGLCRVTRETDDELTAIGLMWLLPDGSVPISIVVRLHELGFAWSVRLGREDGAWRALSRKGRWDAVYLHAGGELAEPPWEWTGQIDGICAVPNTG